MFAVLDAVDCGMRQARHFGKLRIGKTAASFSQIDCKLSVEIASHDEDYFVFARLRARAMIFSGGIFRAEAIRSSVSNDGVRNSRSTKAIACLDRPAFSASRFSERPCFSRSSFKMRATWELTVSCILLIGT